MMLSFEYAGVISTPPPPVRPGHEKGRAQARLNGNIFTRGPRVIRSWWRAKAEGLLHALRYLAPLVF